MTRRLPDRPILFFFAKCAISGSLIYWLYRSTPISDIVEVFRSIDPLYLLWVPPLIVCNAVLCTQKWRILLRADGIRVPLFQLLRIYMIGNFFNLFLPTNIGGDSYRIYLLSKVSKETVRSIASVFADRFSGFFALALFSTVSSLAILEMTGEASLFVIPAALLFVFLVLLILLYQEAFVLRVLALARIGPNGFVADVMGKFLRSVKAYGGKKTTLLHVFLLSLLYQFLVITCIYIFSLSMNLSVPFVYFSAFVPLITLMEAIPISINGIGVRDFGYVYFFSMAGMGDVHTRALALMFLTVGILYSLAGGVVYLTSGSLTKTDESRRAFLAKDP